MSIGRLVLDELQLTERFRQQIIVVEAFESFCADGLAVLQDYRIFVTERERPFIHWVCTVFHGPLSASRQRHSRGA